MMQALERNPLYAILGMLMFLVMVIWVVKVPSFWAYFGFLIIPLYAFIGLNFKGRYVKWMNDWIRGFKLEEKEEK